MQMTSQLNLCFLYAHFVAKKIRCEPLIPGRIFAPLQKTVRLVPGNCKFLSNFIHFIYRLNMMSYANMHRFWYLR